MTRPSSLRHASPRYTSGFTLLELLVVIFIVGLLASLAVLAIGNNQSERTLESVSRLTALTGLAREEALFNGRDLALSFWENGYAFHVLGENGEWAVLQQDPQLQPREFPEAVSVDLFLEGLEAELPLEATHRPQVFILSSGEMSAFEARISDDEENAFVVTADILGNLNVVPVER